MDEYFVVDSNIWISLINEKKFEDRLLELNSRSHILISVVTANELLRGAHDSHSRKLVDGYFQATGTDMLVPTKGHWLECASISEEILRNKRKSKEKVLLLQNDILIALGARDAGAMVVTCDVGDFTLIKNYVGCPIYFW